MHIQNNSKNFIWRYAARLFACVVFGIILVVHFSVNVHAEEARTVTVNAPIALYKLTYNQTWNVNCDASGNSNGTTMSVSGVTGKIGSYSSVIEFQNGQALMLLSIWISDQNFDRATYDSAHGYYYMWKQWDSMGFGMTGTTIVSGSSSGVNMSVLKSSNSDQNYCYTVMKNYIDSQNIDFSKKDMLDEGSLEDNLNSSFDFNTDHDFSADVYQSDIPVPEISNASYYGFTVNNAADNLYLDLYIQSSFVGLKHSGSHKGYFDLSSGSIPDSVSFELDSSVFSASHRYNATNYDVAYNNSVVNLASMYGIDVASDLLDDFKTYSSKYPSHKDLPDYSFFSHGSNTWALAYDSVHNYYKSASSTDIEKLKDSGQGSVTYYARFYKDTENGIVYGKWISYKYMPGSAGQSSLEVGDVLADVDGTPYQTNTQIGVQDTDGNVNYNWNTGTSGNSQSIGTVNVGSTTQSMIDVLKELPSLAYYYTNFSQFLVATFAFIPATIWMLIVNAFRLSLVVLLYKYVRGM